MKNPFVQMAVMAAAMIAAFKEDVARSAGVKFGGIHGSRMPGKRNPAGSKIIRKFYRNHWGSKGTFSEAHKWYHALK